MAYEELFSDLLKAEREEDVTAALTVFGLEKFSDSNWVPYGGPMFENNFGLIGAQQADALGALVEKVVNSIDAVLMRECFARNLDPRSNLVPQSMSEAAEQFLSIPDGNLAKLTDVENDYLVRAFEPGKLIIRPEALVKSTSLYNGRLELQLAPEKVYDAGHRIEVKVMLTSPNSPEGYFSVRFWLEIDPPVQPTKNPPGQRKPPKVSAVALPEIKEIKKEHWSDGIEISSDEDVVKIMKDTQTTSLVNMDNRHYRRYVYANPKREQEIKNLYKISSTIMGLWLLEQVDKGGLQEENRRSVSNSLGRLLLPLIDSLGSKLAELDHV